MANGEADRPRDATTGGTQPLPEVPLTASTAGLPLSVTATTPQPAPPLSAPPAFQVPPPPPAQHPLPYPEQAQGQEPPPSRRRRATILVLCALLGTVLGVGAQRLTGGHGQARIAKPVATTAPAPVRATITSFDPSTGGSGFRQQDGTWRSQTYSTAKFGGLKPGIGLLLDAGSARSLRSVTIAVQSGPITVELRAADTQATSADGYQPVGQAVQANGTTTLPASSGGSHQYWLVWVTQLGPANRAVIATVTAQG